MSERFDIGRLRASWYHLHQQEFKTRNVSLVRTNKLMESPGWAQPHCKQGRWTAGAYRNGRRRCSRAGGSMESLPCRDVPGTCTQHAWPRSHRECSAPDTPSASSRMGLQSEGGASSPTCQVGVNTCTLSEMVPPSPHHGKVVHNMEYAEWSSWQLLKPRQLFHH